MQEPARLVVIPSLPFNEVPTLIIRNTKETVLRGAKKKSQEGARRGEKINTGLSMNREPWTLARRKQRSSNIPEAPRASPCAVWTVSLVPSPGSSLFTRSRGTLSLSRAHLRSFLLLSPRCSQHPPRSLAAAESTRRCDTRSTALPRSLTRDSCTEKQHWKLGREGNAVHTPAHPRRPRVQPWLLKDRGGKSVVPWREGRESVPAWRKLRIRLPVDARHSAAPSRKRGETRAHSRGRNAPVSGERDTEDKGKPGFHWYRGCQEI